MHQICTYSVATVAPCRVHRHKEVYIKCQTVVRPRTSRVLMSSNKIRMTKRVRMKLLGHTEHGRTQDWIRDGRETQPDASITILSVDKENQLDVNFCILYFSSNSCSTCFGQPCAHHQELTTAWCYSLVLVCAVAAGRWSRPTRCQFLYPLFLF